MDIGDLKINGLFDAKHGSPVADYAWLEPPGGRSGGDQVLALRLSMVFRLARPLI